jgi:hypothetical protein
MKKLTKPQQKILDLLKENPTAKIFKKDGSMFSKQSIKVNIENPDTGGLYNMTLATFGKLVEYNLIKREKEDSNFIWVLNN